MATERAAAGLMETLKAWLVVGAKVGAALEPSSNGEACFAAFCWLTVSRVRLLAKAHNWMQHVRHGLGSASCLKRICFLPSSEICCIGVLECQSWMPAVGSAWMPTSLAPCFDNQFTVDKLAAFSAKESNLHSIASCALPLPRNAQCPRPTRFPFFTSIYIPFSPGLVVEVALERQSH